MTTDVDVQFFSHLNGLTLGNNWGDLIRLLDKALVTGIDFTQITAASIDTQGDVHITLYAAHNAMLFQVVELTGFAPSSLNQKYRIKGVPNTTQLILKPVLDIIGGSITTIGTGKLASLGYEVIFRDSNDVKRVYRAKNPSAQHPYIRVDETISDGVNSYNSNYAKYAMVGLLEHMDHIDDYEDPAKLQLPFSPANPAKNWKITGTESGVVRGWGRWYVAASNILVNNPSDNAWIESGNRNFTLVGDDDCFYLLSAQNSQAQYKDLKGCGLFKSSLSGLVVPNWFLMSYLTEASAKGAKSSRYSSPLSFTEEASQFLVPEYNPINKIAASKTAYPIIHSYSSGSANLNEFTANNVPALEIPFYDENKYLRGNLKHVFYAGKKASNNIHTTPILADSSMYLWENITTSYGGGVYFYLGELE
ncbi:hypothetical protein [Acinetobacter sp. YH12126]|uniref:hypothetical protein n=1 Tax=Acinetobacter sp. YH12126 TaxID=2601111 RepID=UPI0015D1950D|nr:hypothetical protein [Acinetobacter sp. YH12126]